MTCATTVGLLVAAAWLPGCSRSERTFLPVEGTVTSAGKPVPDVLVTFVVDPESDARGPRTWGVTGPDGRYRLRTDAGADGAVVGRHRVTLAAPPSAALLSGPTDGPSTPAAARGTVSAKPDPAHIPKEFGEVWRTPLRAEVKPDGTVTGSGITLPEGPGGK